MVVVSAAANNQGVENVFLHWWGRLRIRNRLLQRVRLGRGAAVGGAEGAGGAAGFQ